MSNFSGQMAMMLWRAWQKEIKIDRVYSANFWMIHFMELHFCIENLLQVVQMKLQKQAHNNLFLEAL